MWNDALYRDVFIYTEVSVNIQTNQIVRTCHVISLLCDPEHLIQWEFALLLDEMHLCHIYAQFE